MNCTYCTKALPSDVPGARALALVEFDDDDSDVVSHFCDRQCLFGWAMMTAVDEALARKASPPVTAEELREKARLQQICDRCGQHVRHHTTPHDELEFTRLIGFGRQQARFGDHPWWGLFCPERIVAD